MQCKVIVSFPWLSFLSHLRRFPDERGRTQLDSSQVSDMPQAIYPADHRGWTCIDMHRQPTLRAQAISSHPISSYIRNPQDQAWSSAIVQQGPPDPEDCTAFSLGSPRRTHAAHHKHPELLSLVPVLAFGNAKDTRAKLRPIKTLPSPSYS